MSILPRNQTLGRDLRALRKARGLTLAELSGRIGRSVGWLSQVERDLSAPTFDELQAMAGELGVTLSTLFGQTPTVPGEEGKIVRKHARRLIGASGVGLVEELLSPDLTDDFEMVHSTFEPGAARAKDAVRPTQEVGFIVSGQLDLTISGTTHRLTAGDSFRIRGEPFRWSNPTTEPCVAIWVIAPPVY